MMWRLSCEIFRPAFWRSRYASFVPVRRRNSLQAAACYQHQRWPEKRYPGGHSYSRENFERACCLSLYQWTEVQGFSDLRQSQAQRKERKSLLAELGAVITAKIYWYNRYDYVQSGCKPRLKRLSWHGLRHLYFKEKRRRLIAKSSMTEHQVENEMSERMGYHFSDVKKFYSEFLKDS